MIPHKIFFTSKLRSFSEVKLWFALEKLDEHTVMLSEMCHGQLHGLGIAPLTVATWHWPKKNLWTTEESPFSPQPYPLATQTQISMSFGHCSATKETHGIIRYHFLLQEQLHNEDPSVDILNAQRRTLLTLKTSTPLLIRQHCKEAEPPLRLPRSTMYRSPQKVPTVRLDFSWDVGPLGNVSKERKLMWSPTRKAAQIVRDKAQLLWAGEDAVTQHGISAVPTKLEVPEMRQ